MLLSSSLEPNGPKSTHHYLVLHHEDQRRLIKLPESYSDLKKEVESAYRIDCDRFHVETKELNVCAGERIRIPEEAWSDLSKLLGNVYVVPCSEEVLKSKEVLEVEEVSKSDDRDALKSEVQSKSEVLSKGEELSGDESQAPLKNQELSRGEEKVEEASNSHPESFPGPEAVSPPTTVQAGPDMINIDKNELYEQILACDSRVSGVLEAVREEIKLYKHSRSGIKWQSQYITSRIWTDFTWDARPHSIYVARYSLARATSSKLQVCFLGTATQLQIHIDVYVSSVDFWEIGNGVYDRYHTFNLSHSMHAAGDHSIAFVNHGGQILVFFDFKEYTLLPRATMIGQRPDKVLVMGVPGNLHFEDVYDFN